MLCIWGCCSTEKSLEHEQDQLASLHEWTVSLSRTPGFISLLSLSPCAYFVSVWTSDSSLCFPGELSVWTGSGRVSWQMWFLKMKMLLRAPNSPEKLCKKITSILFFQSCPDKMHIAALPAQILSSSKVKCVTNPSYGSARPRTRSWPHGFLKIMSEQSLINIINNIESILIIQDLFLITTDLTISCR